MSVVTLKKKYQAQYRNSSVGLPQFSINGTHRSQGYVGQTMLSRSLPTTPMNGIYPRGHGGCCGKFVIKPIVQSAVTSLNNPNIIKPSVVSSKGMLEEELKCINKLKIPNVSHKLPQYTLKNIVKPDNNQHSSTQEDYITRKVKKTIQEANNCTSNDQIKNQTYGCKNRIYHSNFSKQQCYYTKPKSNFVAMSQGEYIIKIDNSCINEDIVYPKNTCNIVFGSSH